MSPAQKERLQTALLYLLFVLVYAIVFGLIGVFVGIVTGSTPDDVLRGLWIGVGIGVALGLIMAVAGRQAPLPPDRRAVADTPPEPGERLGSDDTPST